MVVILVSFWGPAYFSGAKMFVSGSLYVCRFHIAETSGSLLVRRLVVTLWPREGGRSTPPTTLTANLFFGAAVPKPSTHKPNTSAALLIHTTKKKLDEFGLRDHQLYDANLYYDHVSQENNSRGTTLISPPSMLAPTMDPHLTSYQTWAENIFRFDCWNTAWMSQEVSKRLVSGL